MSRAFLAALLLFPVISVRAVDISDIDAQAAEDFPEETANAVARRIQRERASDYAAMARKRLKSRGEVFDFARVEVTGVMSNDDTNLIDQRMFDVPIKPSYSADEKKTLRDKIIDRVKRFKNPATEKDLDELDSALRGEVTKRALSKLAPYQGKEIEEIVAHSWGTEFVYAAILNGKLRPPKKLIVIGVPDNDFDKWEMLAARTGTEVHFARASNDLAAMKGAERAKIVARSVDFKAKWDAVCAGPNAKDICHAHGRVSAPVAHEMIGDIPSIGGHGRAAYYDVLRGKVIKGSAQDLRKAQTARVAAETRQVQKDELETNLLAARVLVEEARVRRETQRNDEQFRQAELSRCSRLILRFGNAACSQDSLDLEVFVRARECYRTNAAPPWKVLEPPAPTILPTGCLNDILRELARHPDATADGVFDVIQSFYERASTKVYSCLGTMQAITQAACAAEGRLTADDLISFYKAVACKRANEMVPPARPTPQSCAQLLEADLERRGYSLDDANQLARYYWQASQPLAPEVPKAPPPLPPAQPDPEPRRPPTDPGCNYDYGVRTCPVD